MSDALTASDGKQLLQLARTSLEHFVRTGQRVALPADVSPALEEGLGAFVTLTTGDGSLRGCIGNMVAHGPLIETVREMAIAAGTHDPRFPPVSEEELRDLRYEISVISPMVESRADQVVPGRHGLYIRNGRYSGTLLPQVASEHGWDRATFLEQTCVKAGLSPLAWKDPGTTIYTYTAQVFSEEA
ncbi:MAG: AmmeMemoRadiSam system protein A [Planctomycetota bacterium]|nr:AMMECR1 domain-containing protein [Planctomycetota bacterium]GIK51970.1 MAG: AmmeMemoRadiSam system protein A [Planctomycetota bacterium]